MLQLASVQVQVQDQAIVRGVDLEIAPGEVHAIMGPNGSGKSSLAKALAGHPEYELHADSRILLDGMELGQLSPDQRAQHGLFLAFQYPVEVPGVRVERFLRLAHQARFADQPDKQLAKAIDFRRHLQQLADQLQIKQSLLTRGLNEDFSGGEKKRLEVLQMAVLEPKYAILDETDSGLDIDAIKAVAQGVNWIRQQYQTGMLIITHYQRILDYIQPDLVHVMVAGKIVASGDYSLVAQLETAGYAQYE